MQAVYIINFILPFIYVVYLKLSRLDAELQNKLFLILYSVQVVLFTGTRTIDTGADTGNYNAFFESLQYYEFTDLFESPFEFIFSLIYFIAFKMGIGFVGANILISAIGMFFLSKSIYKIGLSPVFSCYLYMAFSLVNNMMNQIRQALAMTVIFYAVTFLTDKKPLKFIVLTLLASGVHLSALFTLVLLLVYKKTMNKKTVGLYVLLSILVLVFSDVLLQLVSLTSYGSYLSQEWRYSAFEINSIINLIVRIAMLLFVLYFLPPEIDKENNIYYHMTFLCTIMQITAVFNSAMSRITTMFFFAYLILIPKCLEESNKLKGYKIFTYPLAIVAFFMYYLIYNFGHANTYESFWFG